jgi:hypothetical protein
MMLALPAMTAAAAACKSNGLCQQDVHEQCISLRTRRCIGSNLTVGQGSLWQWCQTRRMKVLNRTRSCNRNAATGTHLNPGDVATHDAGNDARSPVPRRPRVKIHAGRSDRQPMAHEHHTSNCSTLKLSCRKQYAHVAAGRRRLLAREGMAAGQTTTRGGSLNNTERRIDRCDLLGGNLQGLSEIVVVIFEGQGLQCSP